ncbi:hypothetical protein ACN47E_008278 [Coniothyrium glycines]
MSRCTVCNNLEKRDEDDVRLGFEFAPRDLVKTAFLRGCDVCLVLNEGLRQVSGDSWMYPDDIRSVYARCLEKCRDELSTLYLEVYFKDERPKLMLEFYCSRKTAWKSILPRTSVHHDYTAMVEWARTKFDTCRRFHQSCRAQELPKLPSRILSLIHDTNEGEIKIQLQEPGDQRGIYVALSHRWSEVQTCTTTSDNINARRHGISWAEIPLTYRDAILFAVSLGFNYIWIDSLCIIQDDQQDWEIESSRMADVYEGAIMTLSATSSSGDTLGCFPVDKSPSLNIEIDLPARLNIPSINIRSQHKHWDGMTANQLRTNFPLLTRGWVFQERLLSTRILHLCSTELTWECREHTICECGALDKADGVSLRHYLPMLKEKGKEDVPEAQATENVSAEYPSESKSKEDVTTLFGRQKALRTVQNVAFELAGGMAGKADLDYIFRYWGVDPYRIGTTPELVQHFHRIIEQYSSLKLTKPKDRLPALSGLCKPLKDIRGTYLAGIWSDSLSYDLMWRVDALHLEDESDYRHEGFRWPSWSWISVNGPVKYWHDIGGDSADIVICMMQRLGARKPLVDNEASVKFDISRLGQNPFGEVAGGRLDVEVSVAFVTLQYTDIATQYTIRVDITEAGGRGHIDVPFFADYILSASGPYCVEHGAQIALLEVHSSVALVLWKGPPENKDSSTNDVNVWQRIGIARISATLVDTYYADWMEFSEVRLMTIV